MPLRNDLEIFIITYNREKELAETLESLSEAPVRDFSITILDNFSTDGTEQICSSYKNKLSNLRYIKNNRNIGATGNVLKAMELASKKWMWILGDDDSYDWSAWDEIEAALLKDYDIVNTTWHDGAQSDSKYVLFNELGFISTGIYQTKYLNPVVMQNGYYLCQCWNPHSAIVAEVMNTGGKVYAPSKKLVIENMRKDYTNIRMPNTRIHKEVRNFNVVYITLKLYELIEAKRERYKYNEVLCLGSDFRTSMHVMFECGMNLRRLVDVFFMLSTKQKFILISVILKRLIKGRKIFRKFV